MSTRSLAKSRILDAVRETASDLRRLGFTDNRQSKVMRIGILPPAGVRKRAIAIASGDHKPKASEPKVWFTSMKSLADVLSDENRALLRVIVDTQPASLAELARAVECTAASLSRPLRTMSRYGIVDLKREGNVVRPVVNATQFEIVAIA